MSTAAPTQSADRWNVYRWIFSFALAPMLTGCLTDEYILRPSELERLANAPPESKEAVAHVRARQELLYRGQGAATPSTMLHYAEVSKEELKLAIDAVQESKRIVKVANDAVGTEKPPSKDKPVSPEKKEEAEKEKESDAMTAVLVTVAIVGSVFVGIVLASSEGARYDGTLALGPEQPVHLYKGGKEIGWVHAKDLHPSMLASVDDAVVTDRDGPLPQLGRAPLDRKGFVYQVELGGTGMNTLSRKLSLGFTGRTELGWFPAQRFGLLGGLALQTGQKGEQEIATEVRPLIEAQVWPLRLDTLHLGLYAEGGYSIGSERIDVGVSRSTDSWAFGGGLLGQLDVSTFFGLFGRAGALVYPSPDSQGVFPTVSVGLAIY